MRRLAYTFLLSWKNAPVRKPLIVRGARQVGKTWLMKHFGKNEYEHVVYVNFEEAKHLQNLFETGYDTERILTALQIETGQQIIPDKTLIILDEIQEAACGLTALKYFNENRPDLDIMVAGSYLGLSISPGCSFPVGKVEFLDLFPMNFNEYLWATKNEALVDLITNRHWDLIKTFKSKYVWLLKHYYITGGMPEVVKTYIETKDFYQIRRIQNNILKAYESDFGKYAPASDLPRLRMVWQSIPSQLAKEKRKFVFSHIKKGSRAKDFEKALEWLQNSGLVFKVYRVGKPALPLKSYKDIKAFKLFMHDVGLLGALSDLDIKTILEKTDIFTEFKGALSEQYVFQQLKISKEIYYWSSEKSQNEIDFIFEENSRIIPIEVKAEENTKSKSLSAFCKKFNLKHAVRFSLKDYKEESWLINIPLYATGIICKTINNRGNDIIVS